MKFQISLEDMQDFEFRTLAAASSEDNRKLWAVVKNGIVHYEVFSKQGLICNTANLSLAVDEFNRA